jgi:hypothetical protein
MSLALPVPHSFNSLSISWKHMKLAYIHGLACGAVALTYIWGRSKVYYM